MQSKVKVSKKAVTRLFILLFAGGIALIMLAFKVYSLESQIKVLEVRVDTLEQSYSEMSKTQAEIIDVLKQMDEVMDKYQSQSVDPMMYQVSAFTVTAYSPLDDRNGLNADSDPEHMATMAKTEEVIDYAIAVDPKVIPYGTWVFIEGVGWRQALDTGGAIKGNRIDVSMRTYNDAIQFGRQELRVILPEQNTGGAEDGNKGKHGVATVGFFNVEDG